MLSMRALFATIKSAIVRSAAATQQAANPGAASEATAARHLQAQGLTVLARNVRCRGGEIDLICRDGESIVFVEVRMRSRADFGGAAGSVTRSKQGRVILAAQLWLQRAGVATTQPPCRFDVVLLRAADDPQPEWIRNAFSA